MANNDRKSNAGAKGSPNATPNASKKAQPRVDIVKARTQARENAMSQARLRSLARAQAMAQMHAANEAQKNARIRALEDEQNSSVQQADPATVPPQASEAPTVQPDQVIPQEVNVTKETAEPQEEPASSELKAASMKQSDEELEFAIQIHDLYKAYGKKQVLKGLNLDVYPGELFGFIGRIGIGKSTTIDCMIGAKRFNSGSIIVGGYDIRTETLDAKYSYGYVASEPTCYEVMTGYDYLEFVASIYGLTETEFTGNYQYLCKRLQLNIEELSHHISGYSHGMKQKLCLVASLLHNPNIWILDEPTVGLDIMAQEELKKMMREYANHGRTVFVTSHNIEMVSAICDRVAIINDGVVQGVYDLNREPEIRSQLSRIFIETYGG